MKNLGKRLMILFATDAKLIGKSKNAIRDACLELHQITVTKSFFKNNLGLIRHGLKLSKND